MEVETQIFCLLFSFGETNKPNKNRKETNMLWGEQKMQRETMESLLNFPNSYRAHNIPRTSYMPSPSLTCSVTSCNVTNSKEREKSSTHNIFPFIHSSIHECSEELTMWARPCVRHWDTVGNKTEIVSALREFIILWGRWTLKYDGKDNYYNCDT